MSELSELALAVINEGRLYPTNLRMAQNALRASEGREGSPKQWHRQPNTPLYKYFAATAQEIAVKLGVQFPEDAVSYASQVKTATVELVEYYIDHAAEVAAHEHA